MNHYFYFFHLFKKLCIVFFVGIVFFVTGVFAQLFGTGDRPEDWGDNYNNISGQLVNMLNADEDGKPYPQEANPNSGFINSANTFDKYMGVNFNTNNNTNNKTDNKKINNNIDYPCTILTTFLSVGSKGVNVYALQTFLYHFEYMQSIPNGYFGPATESAVKDFQADKGISVRGYVGPNTRGAIAATTCNNDKVSINKAMYVAPPASIVAKTSTIVPTQPSIGADKKLDSNVNNQIVDSKESIFKKNNKTTITTKDEDINTKTSKLSATSLSFANKNSLYFSYTIEKGESLSICFENKKNSSCPSSKFVKISDNAEGKIVDYVLIDNKWNFTVYNSDDWVAGGKVNIKSGSNIYTVNISK